MGLYNNIREKIYRNQTLFKIIRFFFTPFRHLREYKNRRAITNVILEKNKGLTVEDKKVFYFGIPEHNNLGDMAQTYCTRKWITNNYPDYKIVEIRTRASFDTKLIEYIKRILGEDDLFIFQSGYCTRDKNPDHLMHLNIMQKFPQQRAVILPQTVLLKSSKEIARTKEILGKATKCLFITRDAISFEKAKKFVEKDRLLLYPDIVTSLIGAETNSIKRSGILYCVRNDDEKYYSDDEISASIERMKCISERVEITDTNSTLDVWETYKGLESIILDKIRTFGSYKAIITDRYHGTIFSLIANTPVIVVKTNDHKVSSGVDWFDGIFDKTSVTLADNLRDAESIAKSIIQKDISVSNSDYFFEHYYKDRLKLDIERIDTQISER